MFVHHLLLDIEDDDTFSNLRYTKSIKVGSTHLRRIQFCAESVGNRAARPQNPAQAETPRRNYHHVHRAPCMGVFRLNTFDKCTSEYKGVLTSEALLLFRSRNSYALKQN